MANCPGTKGIGAPTGASERFHDFIAEELDVVHLVVVECNEVACEELPVGVEGEPDGTDRHVDPAQRRCLRERRPVEDAVHKSHGYEEPRRAVKRPPALIAAEYGPCASDSGDLSQRDDGWP